MASVYEAVRESDVVEDRPGGRRARITAVQGMTPRAIDTGIETEHLADTS